MSAMSSPPRLKLLSLSREQRRDGYHTREMPKKMVVYCIGDIRASRESSTHERCWGMLLHQVIYHHLNAQMSRSGEVFTL